MLDPHHRRMTLRVAPIRTATPQPMRRAVAPRRPPLREALSGTVVVATLMGLVVAPLAILAVGGLTLALLVVGLGAPGLAAVAGGIYQRRVGTVRAGWMARQLDAVALGSVVVAVLFAMGGMSTLFFALEQPDRLAALLATTLSGTAYALLLAVSAVGAALELRRDASVSR